MRRVNWSHLDSNPMSRLRRTICVIKECMMPLLSTRSYMTIYSFLNPSLSLKKATSGPKRSVVCVWAHVSMPSEARGHLSNRILRERRSWMPSVLFGSLPRMRRGRNAEERERMSLMTNLMVKSVTRKMEMLVRQRRCSRPIHPHLHLIRPAIPSSLVTKAVPRSGHLKGRTTKNLCWKNRKMIPNMPPLNLSMRLLVKWQRWQFQ
mmetsp:Transcript_29690/g.62992  ORF Transcript_29690/g.62992 Transcript_29690/m.62992 type:complete len:206 (-) Transcript_29690:1480-2097(-)